MTRFGEHFEARVAQQRQQQQQAPDLDPVTQARWDRWVEAKINAGIDGAAEATFEEIDRLRVELMTEIKALRSELMAEIRKRGRV